MSAKRTSTSHLKSLHTKDHGICRGKSRSKDLREKRVCVINVFVNFTVNQAKLSIVTTRPFSLPNIEWVAIIAE